MNRMGEVLDLLGIEDYSVGGQEYKLVDDNNHEVYPNRLYKRVGDKLVNSFGQRTVLLEEIILGKYNLVPRPWVPTEGDNYYIIDTLRSEGFSRFAIGTIDIILRLSKRGVKFYRTRKEVEAEVERLYESGEWER